MSQPETDPDSHGSTLPATAAQTRAHLIERSGRSFAPIPKAFIQNPDRKATPDRSAPLADFVRRGDKRGLTALLLLHSIISSGDHADGWSSTLHLQVWARALDTVATASGASATSAATKILSRLVERRLIERRRAGRERQITITLLSADGSGEPYTRPTGATQGDRFIRLNHQFWADDWAQTLTLPAIAMLLVALHEKAGFTLPTEHMPRWYGWSADTAERGLHELRERGLIHIGKQVYTDPISPSGVSSKNIYTVQAPFDVASVDRDAARGKTRR
ncbi:MAG: hypothetical protein ACRCXL_10920 [Dermatophilaceae bacterium]